LPGFDAGLALLRNVKLGPQGPFFVPGMVFFSHGQRCLLYSFLMDKTSFIQKFITNAGSSIVSVRFVKLDGSLRSVQFNPRDRQEIKGTGSSTTKASIIRCRDFRQAKAGNAAWRSFDTDRVISIQANGQHVFF
jgi:hypothetical protein